VKVKPWVHSVWYPSSTHLKVLFTVKGAASTDVAQSAINSTSCEPGCRFIMGDVDQDGREAMRGWPVSI
jgi:hypothetical protein